MLGLIVRQTSQAHGWASYLDNDEIHVIRLQRMKRSHGPDFAQKPDAVAYARSFLAEWKNRLEKDQGSKFSNNKGIGQQFSKSFFHYLRYAHENWPEKLSTGHYELTIRDESFEQLMTKLSSAK